jgi:single-strand DNA-binding protein
MSTVNRVILVGNLGADPEIRYLPSGQARCQMSVATSWVSTKDGQRNERTDWHRIVAWGKSAELCKQYLAKGHKVCVEGRLRHDSYEKDGQRKYITEVVSDRVHFLERRGDGSAAHAAPSAEPEPAYPEPPAIGAQPRDPPPRVAREDDIPF